MDINLIFILKYILQNKREQIKLDMRYNGHGMNIGANLC